MKNTHQVSGLFFLISTFVVPVSAWADEQAVVTGAIPEVVISASPLARPLFEQAQPVGVLEGSELSQSPQATIGDALATQPGVASSSFGAGASRPVIRGQGGDRVRVLQNGVGTMDASNASPDHAVAIEPSQVERIEIVRGPATLLYGTNAVGGVVNVIDNRIPEELPEKPSGSLNMKASTVDNQGSTGAAVTAPIGDFVLHVDGLFRDADNYRIPNFARTNELRQEGPTEGGGEPRRRLPYSYADAEGASAGGSYIFENGSFMGASVSLFNTTYGVPNGEEDVSINLKQRRFDTRGRFNEPFDGVQSAEYRLGVVNYEHTEFEGGEPGTIFHNDAFEGRMELEHEKIFGALGTVGLQYQYGDFEAIGAEAFQPPSVTNVGSLFVFEEFELVNALVYQFGVRLDSQSVSSPSFRVADDADPARRKENFFTVSGSNAVVWTPEDEYAVALSLTRTERAPVGQELFARGVHVATGAHEIGDPSLDTEKSIGADLTLRKRNGIVTGSVSGFANWYDNYIALFPNGNEVEEFKSYDFRGVDALFTGFELQSALHLLGDHEDHSLLTKPEKLAGKVSDEKAPAAADRLDLTMQWDYVRAKDEESGQPLPRITPLRALFGVEYERNGFSARAELQHAYRQTRVADFETETAGYTTVNARLSQKLPLDFFRPAEIYLRADNILNEEMRNHVSFIKDVAPLPGRNFLLGMRLLF